MPAPENLKFIFIIGSTRSGTTWLHRMLAEIPDVATLPQELSLFSRYLAPLKHSYARETGVEGHLAQGLPVLVSPEEFQATLRRATSEIYARVHARRPTAKYILDKRPDYGKHIALIEELLPAPKYVHIIRDGRDVAVSMLNARHTMGGFTADAGTAAADWRDAVTMARTGGRSVGPERYIEVRYEQLVSNTVAELARILDFIGIHAEMHQIERIAHENNSERKLVSFGDASLNKLRSSPGAIWKHRLNLMQRYAVARVAGGLLDELNYSNGNQWVCRTWDVPKLYIFVIIDRMRRSVRSLAAIWKHPFRLWH